MTSAVSIEPLARPVIPRRSEFGPGVLMGELVRFRALLWALVVRHLAMRYRGSVLGFLWSFLNPLCLVLVYVLVFRYYIRFTQVEHYAVFLVCGLLPWLWLTSAVSEGTSAIVASGHLITKSMFPPHILPLVAVLTSMVHYVLALPILFVLMYASGVPFHPTLLLVPLVIAGQCILGTGAALLCASLNVFYRDVQHIVANLFSFLFFLCPIVYPASTVPSDFAFTMQVNPIALLVQFYHQLILEGEIPIAAEVGYFCACAALVCLLAVIVYQRLRENFAEML